MDEIDKCNDAGVGSNIDQSSGWILPILETNDSVTVGGVCFGMRHLYNRAPLRINNFKQFHYYHPVIRVQTSLWFLCEDKTGF